MIALYLICVVTFKIRIKIKNDHRNFLARRNTNFPSQGNIDENAKNDKGSPSENNDMVGTTENADKSESIIIKSK